MNNVWSKYLCFSALKCLRCIGRDRYWRNTRICITIEMFIHIYILGIHLCIKGAFTNIVSRLQVRTRRDTFGGGSNRMMIAWDVKKLAFLFLFSIFYFPSPLSIFQVRFLFSKSTFYFPSPACIFQIRLLFSKSAFYFPSPPSIFQVRLLFSKSAFYFPSPACIFQVRFLFSKSAFYFPSPLSISQVRLLFPKPAFYFPSPLPIFQVHFLAENIR